MTRTPRRERTVESVIRALSATDSECRSPVDLTPRQAEAVCAVALAMYQQTHELSAWSEDAA